MYRIGIDLGGTNIVAGVVDENYNILTKASRKTNCPRPADQIAADMAGAALDAIAQANLKPEDCEWIGIGTPGIANSETGIIEYSNNLGFVNVPMVKWISEQTGIPAFIENDANAAAYGEYVAGAAMGAKNAVCITLGTGVGGGVVIDGKVWSGVNGVGSELGHMITVLDGEECTCGNKGCWERYASATAIIRMGKKAAEENPGCEIARSVDGNLDAITAKTVIDAAKAGDEVAVKVFDNYVYHLCAGLVNIINFMDPEVIVLGGGVSHAGQFLLDAIRAKLPSMIFYKTMPYARIELAVLGNDAGIIGAAMLGK